MTEVRHVALDTETTGLSVLDGDRVIEIGAVELIHGVRTGPKFHCFLNPETKEVSKASQEVHGISTEFLADKPTFREIADDFLQFVKGADLIIHNADFDLEFLNHELRNCNRSERLEDCCTITNTLDMAKKLFPGSRANLNALCNRFGITYVQTREKHSALLDAELLATVYVAMMQAGQSDMLSNVDETLRETDVVTDFQKLDRENIVVISANPEEQATHAQYLTDMASEAEASDA